MTTNWEKKMGKI